MEITEEVRRAVYAADCLHWGHLFDLGNVLGGTDAPNPNDARGMPMPALRARDATLLPHIGCSRCGQVWLVIDEPGVDYADAVARVALRMRSVSPEHTDPLVPKPVEGVGDVPIPLAPGVEFDDLPANHPAVQFAQQADHEHAVEETP